MLTDNNYYYSIEKKIKDIMHQAFWDALEEHLKEDPPDLTHAIVLLEEIREVLLAYLTMLC